MRDAILKVSHISFYTESTSLSKLFRAAPIIYANPLSCRSALVFPVHFIHVIFFAVGDIMGCTKQCTVILIERQQNIAQIRIIQLFIFIGRNRWPGFPSTKILCRKATVRTSFRTIRYPASTIRANNQGHYCHILAFFNIVSRKCINCKMTSSIQLSLHVS